MNTSLVILIGLNNIKRLISLPLVAVWVTRHELHIQFKHQMSSSKTMQLSVILAAAIVLTMCQLYATDAQFFTKSSKSIPRMGRRSVQPDQPPSNLMLRRALIDSLLDEYGPNLLELLRVSRLNLSWCDIYPIESDINDLGINRHDPWTT